MLNEVERKRERQRQPSALLEGTVQDPPLDGDTGFVRVELDGAPGATHDCPWMPRADEGDPSPGDAAAVMESDHGNYWIVCWWPQ